MSRCKACDVILNEFELKKIDRSTGLHLDLCNVCVSFSNEAITDTPSNNNTLYIDLNKKDLDELLDKGYTT